MLGDAKKECIYRCFEVQLGLEKLWQATCKQGQQKSRDESRKRNTRYTSKQAYIQQSLKKDTIYPTSKRGSWSSLEMVTIPQNFNCHAWKNDFYFDLVIFDNQANLMGMLRCETFVNYCVMRRRLLFVSSLGIWSPFLELTECFQGKSSNSFESRKWYSSVPYWLTENTVTWIKYNCVLILHGVPLSTSEIELHTGTSQFWGRFLSTAWSSLPGSDQSKRHYLFLVTRDYLEFNKNLICEISGKNEILFIISL